MKTFYKILCVCFALAWVFTRTTQDDRVTELETERDIYQSRAKNAESEVQELSGSYREPNPFPFAPPDLQPDAMPMEYVGTFEVAANCCEESCDMCGGTGITASGAPQVAGVTAGANFDALPAGTWIYIEGVGIRVVQDTGPDCPADHIDVAVDTHEEALSWAGYGKHKVWVLQEAQG